MTEWKLVPVEPIDAMLEAASDGAAGHFAIDGDAGPWLSAEGYAAAYRAMLAAAPPPPVQQGEASKYDDLLEAQQAQIERLAEALRPFARIADDAEGLAGHDGPLGQYVVLHHLRRARSALKEVTGEE
jgi:hypothetical protein